MDFGSVTGAVNSATNAVSTAGNVLSNIGPASGLSGIANAVTGALGAIGSFFKSLDGVKLPLKNPLHAYASYDYVIGLGCLSDDEINHPDATYMTGKPVRLVCKSANADPSNRVNTPYGKFDFFIDNLELKSTVGLDEGNTTTVTNISFTITEPYSMGLFPIAVQQIAQELGHDNFREAPFVITIEFRGNKETGTIENISGSKRAIPFIFSDMTMKVTDAGSVYTITAMPWTQTALTDDKNLFKSDVTVAGDTVQAILQTGEKSLQAVINQKCVDIAKVAGPGTQPDQYVILFPQDTASIVSVAGSNATEDNSSATTSTDAGSSQQILDKLGLTVSALNETYVQQAGDVNGIGAASLGFGGASTKKASTPVGADNKIYDPASGLNIRSNNVIDATVTDMKFSQATDIPNAINQAILNSNFSSDTLDASKISPTGMRGWWRIDTQVYNIGSVQKSTGTKPKLIIYRVIPYEVHTSRIMPPNTKAPGFANLGRQAVKEYNYIYTGKNVDVISFEINMNQGFYSAMSSGDLSDSQDVKQAAQYGEVAEPVKVGNPLQEGSVPTGELGTTPTITRYNTTKTNSDKKGGGGTESIGTRAARTFMDAVTNGTDLYNLDIQILGDPYFIVQSGMANYTAQGSQYSNLNADGTMNYQNGEVDVLVTFRTPIDINQTTGLYNFGSGAASVPVMQYSGLYCLTNVTSTFKQGQFKQRLTGFRRPLQENLFEATPEQTFNVSNQAVDKTNPENTGD